MSSALQKPKSQPPNSGPQFLGKKGDMGPRARWTQSLCALSIQEALQDGAGSQEEGMSSPQATEAQGTCERESWCVTLKSAKSEDPN